MFINNARYEINRIRDIAIFLDWPQDLVDNMFKTQNVNIDLSIKALQEFICLSKYKNNNLIQAYKDTSTKEGIANFIKVCGDLIAFPSEHAQTGDKVLPDIAKTTEDKPTGDGVVDKAVSEQVVKEAEIETSYGVLLKEIKLQIQKSTTLVKIQDTYVFIGRFVYVIYDPVNKIISLIDNTNDSLIAVNCDECKNKIQNKCLEELTTLTYKEFTTLEEALDYKPTIDNVQNLPINVANHIDSVPNTETVHIPNSILDKIKFTVSPKGIRNEHYDAVESADHFIVFNIKKNKMFISPKTVENKLRYSHSAFPRTTIWDKEKLMMMIDTCTKVYKEKLKLPK